MERPIGISTWVWDSPLTDANLGGHLARIAALGFDAVELPLENDGDFTAAAVREALQSTGLTPYLVGAMAPGRDLVSAAPASVEATQAYLLACVAMAASIGSPTLCGPFYAQTGRTWRMSPEQRREAYAELRRNLKPVADRALEAGVVLGIEPLNRYETSLINTVEQALEALGPLLGNGVGIALDSYHLHIEERSLAAAVRAAGEHVVHVQVCGNDRGAPGGDQTDWDGFLQALDEVGYTGPLNIESFTADNAAIAIAASIWRPLAPSQDELAAKGLAFLRDL
ncbi:xylose isomerase-like TIM barrel family protein [Pseudarthrobacter siccitolerans]|uniref:Xylose isomerase-like TIM barrel family protein n=1 Tax=Pseudarthrobacter siccitolerans TaxID=861266 RepID=A0A024H5Z6_9MICC|nr:sugar phosphate isomerase/epimerase family protein [Pseudarthrobacter siccitolerans]CCQ47156.1 xylose isomerase-like TIM barrel family protein [Pseudarthrobacter siccitolerans]